MTRTSKIILPVTIIAVIVILLLGAAWLFGPRTPVDTTITFDPATIGDDLDAYLDKAEAKIRGIQPNQHKDIVWADPETKARTPISIIYIHGFSASPGEMRPLPDIIAGNLRANLYFARLKGHGTTTDAMADVSVNAWVNDLAEAVAIGERLGERVVVMGTSTGGALATWSLTRPEFKNRIHAAVFFSPNYGVQAFGSSLLTVPFARELSRLVLGETRSFEPGNERQRVFWTTSYPVEALLPMAETVKMAVNAPVETISAPALFLISAEDKVVQPAITRAIEKRWGGPHNLIQVDGVEDPNRHVLAGDAMSPATTVQLAGLVASWLKETLELPR
ncbi:alpha/beta hydrolase [Rhizobium sp. LjRoot254]|uniref:alpha/beta hydrolase n=1 Tax=Rhizobium sp. LjRoot254 TaxID=3342297 RepID=UPI003ECE2E9F